MKTHTRDVLQRVLKGDALNPERENEKKTTLARLKRRNIFDKTSYSLFVNIIVKPRGIVKPINGVLTVT
jgi:hypothetical protein